MLKFKTNSLQIAGTVFGITAFLCPLALAADELDKLLNQPPQKISAKVRIAFKSEVDTLECEDGDKVEAELRSDILHDENVLAPAGSRLLGTVKSVTYSRSLAKSVLSKQDRFRRHAALDFDFNELITPDNKHFEFSAKAVPQKSLFTNGSACRMVHVGANGEVTKTESMDLAQLPQFELAVPVTLFQRNRKEVKILPGDEIVIHAEMPISSTAVSAKVVKAKKKSE